jgi:hypothetical protein
VTGGWRARIIGGWLGAVIAWPALAAGICVAPSEPRFEPLPRAGWQDIAKFAFLVGVDNDGSTGAMTLVTRLRHAGSFAQLRASSGAWQATHAQSAAFANQVIGLSNVLTGLAQLCQQLDDAGLGGKPLDTADWTRRMGAIREAVGATAQGLQGDFRGRLETFAVVSASAAKSYADARFPEPPVLPVDPDPVRTATEIGQVWGQWRPIMVDLAKIAQTLPPRPDPDSEKVLADIAAAMPLLVRSIAAARAIAANDLSTADFNHIFTGDYLYDACRIPENTNLHLHIQYNPTKVLTPDPQNQLLYIVPSPNQAPAWRFQRVGAGYWKIMRQSEFVLDVRNHQQDSYPLNVVSLLALKAGVNYSGQYWRCFAAPQEGSYRFVTLFLGEARSMAVDGPTGKVKMLETANDPAQYWQPLPR